VTIKTVCVYCGSSNKVDDIYKKTAHDLGKALADHKIDLVYGGGHVGLMGIVADAVLDNGGKVTGIIPEHISKHEVQHTKLTELIVVDSMHTRKKMMAEKADAFIMLPGGFGTLDETFEILTWKQLGLHTKPVIIYNINNFWKNALNLIDHLIDKGFAQKTNKDLFEVTSDLTDVFNAMNKKMKAPSDPESKWS